jgi:serine-type D-Ala-D-Ala carboxypeptidase
LPNWRPLYLEVSDPADVPDYIAGLADDTVDPKTQPVIYSDLNYILVGMALERLAGAPLDQLAQREIIEPLKLKRTMFTPSPDLNREIAATEYGQAFEQANAADDIESRRSADAKNSIAALPAAVTPPAPYIWREGMIRGEVHDGNAYYLGGVAGHAGLFSTAREVYQLASQSLPGGQLVGESGLHWFSENLTPGRDTARSIGWVLAATADCSAGPALPPTAIGHNGFTGTSVWMDGERRRVLVLLTNRVHPRIGPIEMKSVRQRFNTLAVESLE